MTPLAQEIVHEVAARHRIPQVLILGKTRACRLMVARIEIATLLSGRGYSTTQIGLVLGKERTTITYYLGQGKRRPAKPRWHRPRIKTLWRKLKKQELRLVPPPKKRMLFLIPYAGADMTNYEWKQRA